MLTAEVDIKPLGKSEIEILKTVSDLGGEAGLSLIEEKTKEDVNIKIEEIEKSINDLENTGYVEKIDDKPTYKLTEKGRQLTHNNLSKEKISRILGSTTFNEGFHFYWEIDQYTGKTATTLEDFCKIVCEIGPRSLEFHDRNGDFEKWFSFLGDEYMAMKMNKIRTLNLAGEALRQKILNIAKTRLNELISIK